VLATIISTVSTILFAALLILVLARPSWCPAAICPAPAVVTNPAGAHDANLEIYFIGLQTGVYALPGSPASYSLAHVPPQTVSALRVGPSDKALVPFRVAVGIHSLQRGGRFGLIIDRVGFHIQSVGAVPYPLNVWQPGSYSVYQTNVYQLTYHGEDAGQTLPAVDIQSPGGFTLLNPGESDAIDLQVASVYTADVHFQVQITYRISNESEDHTLTLPQSFEIIFSDSSNWHVYTLQGSQLIPAS
jgi:hypothetical protein